MLSIMLSIMLSHVESFQSFSNMFESFSMPGQGLPKFFLWLAAAKSCTTENLIEVGQNTALYFFGTPHDVNSMQKGFEFQVES